MDDRREDITVDLGRAAAMVAANDLHVTRGGAAAMAAGHDLHVTKGGASWMLAGGEMHVQNGGGAVLVGGKTRLEGGLVGLSIAGKTEIAPGARVLFTTKQALAFGAGLVLAATILRPGKTAQEGLIRSQRGRSLPGG